MPSARALRLEGELDRHQVALHRADERTGLTYRTLLGELIELTAGRPGPLTLPGLRSRLSELHPSQVAIIEESCAPLARFWLPARFEDSALSALKTFSADQGSLDIFIAMFKRFVAAETLRSTANTETSDALRINNPIPIRSWLAKHEAEVRSIRPEVCPNLSRWLTLFRPPGGTTKAGSMVEDLQDAWAGLGSLDASVHGLPASAKLRALQGAEFSLTVALAESAMRSAVGLGRLSPVRWLARRRLRKLLSGMGLPNDEIAMGNFAAAARLERALRPLRIRVETAWRTLFGTTIDAGMSPANLATLAKDIYSYLPRVQQLVKTIDECPVTQLERAVEVGTTEAIGAFLDRIASSLQHFDARLASVAFFRRRRTLLCGGVGCCAQGNNR